MAIDRLAVKAGLGALILLGGLALTDAHIPLRESALDLGLIAGAAAPSGEVIVVAIDSDALQRFGRWPWPRSRLATVVAQIAAANPRVLALDLVLSGPDPAGPVALADVPEAAALPDGDLALQTALNAAPSVLAAALSDHPGTAPLVPLLASGPPVATTPWLGNGLESPTTLRAMGLGVASLRGEDGGILRRAPLLVLAGDAVAPGLAVETLRVAEAATALRLGNGALSIGKVTLPMGEAADFRLRPTDPALWDQRTIPLSQVIDSPPDLAQKIVLLGLTAPQAALLRPTAVTPLAPTVQIEADAVETLLSGHYLQRPTWAAGVEIAATITLALMALGAALSFGPLAAATVTLALAAGWTILAFTLWRVQGLALDPASPALVILGTGLTTVAAALMAARKRAAALRRRFERHLSPAVVAHMVAQPGLTRLPGEAREVTALFTDLEGFSAKAEALSPADLIAILDRYFTGLASIIHGHGGMIEKFVGDAAHVLFNAPFDQPDHARHAIICAQALANYGENFTKDPANQGMGRTRVGLECGLVIVGDVGSGEKLDYTAHGRAMNLAARLEQAGKSFGVTLLAGPNLRATLPDLPWQALGTADLRGFGPVEVFTLS